MHKEKLFTKIWHEYGKNVYFYIQSILPFEHSSYDDLFQEIMLKIYNSLDRIDKGLSVKAWVYRVARNHCIDFLKSKKETVSSNFFEKVDFSPGPEDESLSHELRQTIDRALGKLDPSDREIVYLHFYEDLSFKVISDLVGINVNTIKTRIRKIKRILKTSLSEYGGKK